MDQSCHARSPGTIGTGRAVRIGERARGRVQRTRLWRQQGYEGWASTRGIVHLQRVWLGACARRCFRWRPSTSVRHFVKNPVAEPGRDSREVAELPRSREHGLNGLNGLNGSLGVGAAFVARSRRSIVFGNANTTVVAG